MKKVKQKYNKIKCKMCTRAKNVRVLCGKKISNILDIEKNDFRNALVVITLLFLGSFSLIFLVSINQIEKGLLSIKIMGPEDSMNPILNEKIKEITRGYPIESMSQYIAQENEEVAAFIVSIAKKESNWGKRTPKLNGEECYNYWGFRQKREKMGSGGHTCFNNPRDAVKSVARRVKDLMRKDIDTPEKMVVWKCGYSCDSHNSQSVQKWINDVKLYYNKF